MFFLKRWILKWAVKDLPSELADTTIDEVSAEYLRRAQHSHSSNLKVAQRINQANLLNAQTSDLRDALKQNLDGESEEGEDDDEEEDDVSNNLLKQVLGDIFKGALGGSNQQESFPPMPSPEGTLISSPRREEIRAKLEEKFGAIPDDKLEGYWALAQKYIK